MTHVFKESENSVNRNVSLSALEQVSSDVCKTLADEFQKLDYTIKD